MRKPDPTCVPPRVITVRISPEDYASVQAWARCNGYSLNQFCLDAILARRDAFRAKSQAREKPDRIYPDLELPAMPRGD